MEGYRKCPFCGKLFTNAVIKKHIGVVHLDLDINNFKENVQVKKEIYRSEEFNFELEIELNDIKKERTDLELSENSTIKNTKSSRKVKPKTQHKFKCHCGKTFHCKSNFNRHDKIQHKGFRYKCGKCVKLFNYKRSLMNHTKIMHERVNLKCDCCEESNFSSKSALKLHIENSHITSNVKYKCVICEKSYKFKKDLNRHFREVHQGIKSERNLTQRCKFCEKELTKRSLKRHIETVHNGVRFNCDLCEKSFSQQSTLQTHKVLHHLKT